jgi:hypothetical protein|tara:strand:- start:16215 stop:16835 length:621 start_codon:yes stop_codon:yes gene_type:complete
LVSKEIIVLGTGSTRGQCPYDVEVWGVNGIYSEIELRSLKKLPVRLDKLFITDYLFSPQGHLHFDIDRVNRIAKNMNTKVMMLHELSLGKYRIKGSKYPFKMIANKFKTRYFTSTISYMLAWALHKKCTKVSLYGVDMHGKEEYMMQKGGVEYWLARLQESGADIFVAPGGTILQTPNGLPYGFKPRVDFKVIDPYNLLQLPESKR